MFVKESSLRNIRPREVKGVLSKKPQKGELTKQKVKLAVELNMSSSEVSKGIVYVFFR